MLHTFVSIIEKYNYNGNKLNCQLNANNRVGNAPNALRILKSVGNKLNSFGKSFFINIPMNETIIVAQNVVIANKATNPACFSFSIF